MKGSKEFNISAQGSSSWQNQNRDSFPLTPVQVTVLLCMPPACLLNLLSMSSFEPSIEMLGGRIGRDFRLERAQTACLGDKCGVRNS